MGTTRQVNKITVTEAREETLSTFVKKLGERCRSSLRTQSYALAAQGIGQGDSRAKHLSVKNGISLERTDDCWETKTSLPASS